MMDGRTRVMDSPSRPNNAETEHDGFPPTRQILLCTKREAPYAVGRAA